MTPEDYADKLRQLIERPDSRMLLKASELSDRKGTGPHAAFQLTSKTFLPEFITLWELFDHRLEFEEFIQMFARKAREIHQTKPYAAIVTSTATSKHILEHAHAAIEADRDRVTVHYLGDYPFLDSESRKLLDFQGENVLIVTDVIASGSLVRKMAEIVEEVGGHPIGVLAAILIGPELIRNQVIDFGLIKAKEKPKKLRLYSLAQRSVEPIKEKNGTTTPAIIKIDPVTLLPEEDLLLPNGFQPRFGEGAMFDHFEAAKALDFDFYHMDSRRLTTAVRIKPLLSQYGDLIWREIEPHIDGSETLATTFNRDDVLLKELVEDRLGSHQSFVFIPKRNSLETPNSYFLLPTQLDKVQGKKIVLLLASIYTSERLRNIASLLVSNDAESLTVVCLLNRMGPYTSSFISRIERMVRGLGANQEEDAAEHHAGFKFVFLYSLPDISGDDLNQMQETIRALFDYYIAQTRVPSFRRWMQQDLKYFQFQSMTSQRFEKPQTHPLKAPFQLAINDGPPVSVRSREGKLALLCHRLVAMRDFKPFIETIRDRDIWGKEDLYKIFGILLSDLSYLKMTGAFDDLRATLLGEIRSLRQRRLDFERQSSAIDAKALHQRIELPIDSETHLLFGLALFSYLDYEFDYDPIILEILTNGLEVAETSALPRNFLYYYGDERTVWCLSMLMILSRHEFRQPMTARSLKEELRTTIDQLLKQLDQVNPGSDALGATSQQKVKANFNLLLTELGAHELSTKHQIIRFLHSKIIAVKRSHNPIDSSLDTALLALQSVMAEASVAPHEDPIVVWRRVPVKSMETKKALEDAIYTAGILEEISDAVRQLLVFTSASREDGERYAAEPGLPGFAEDVKKLGDTFQKIRVSNLMSPQDLQTLTDLRNLIAFDLWEKESYLRLMLLRYIVPLRDWTEAALDYADEALRNLGYDNVWGGKRQSVAAWPAEWLVLMDRHLLREVLRNIFSNVRHTFKDYQLQPGEHPSDLVSLGIRKFPAPAPDLKTEERDYFELTVTSRGGTYLGMKEDATFDLHKREVANFAGRLEIHPVDSRQRVEVKLTLLARLEPPKDFAFREESLEDELP